MDNKLQVSDMRDPDISIPIDNTNGIKGGYIWLEENLVSLKSPDGYGPIKHPCEIERYDSQNTHIKDMKELLDTFIKLNVHAEEIIMNYFIEQELRDDDETRT